MPRCFLATALCVMLSTSISAELASIRIGSAPKGARGKLRKKETPQPTAYVAEASAAPAVDGALEDEAWKAASVIEATGMLSGIGAASQKTEVRCLRDDANLYLGFACHESLMKRIKAKPRSHDGSTWEDDSLEIFVGSEKGSRYYQFSVTAAGATYDGKGKDKGWNSGFKAAAAKGERQWSAEMAIPLKAIAGGGKVPDRWIINFNRNRYAGGSLEEFAWSPTYSGSSHVPSRFGRLVFGDPPKTGAKGAKEKGAERLGAVSLFPVEKGEGVIRFDLAGIPEGAVIHRAELGLFRSVQLDGRHKEVLDTLEVFPLFKPYDGKGTPQTPGKPLALKGPWFNRFDATDAVARWVAGTSCGGFYVKTFPFWESKTGFLDIVYEGHPERVPKQVSGVKAFHQSGQTFITWNEIDHPIEKGDITWGAFQRVQASLESKRRLRYVVYRSAKPIDAATLKQAEPLAEVRPLSCWNVNARNLDKAINDFIANTPVLYHHQYNPFRRARLNGKYGSDYAMERLVIREGQAPLASGTGLYVHTAARAGKAYYAVVTKIDGVENTRDFSSTNAAVVAVEERPDEPEPVLQGVLPKHPYYNYKEERLHYVRWVAPPYTNMPMQYHNWAVALPDTMGKRPPVELSLHRKGRSYWKTQYRLETDSIVVSPHDFPRMSYWHGFHEAAGTLKSFKQGVIRNYTEKRVLWFVNWVLKKWSADKNRVTVTSPDMHLGGLQLGLRNPDMFSAVIGGTMRPDPAAYMHPSYATRDRGIMEALWGSPELKLKTDTGKSIWEELNVIKRVREAPPEMDFPIVSYTSHGMFQPECDLLKALLEKKYMCFATFSARHGCRLQPIALNGNWTRMIKVDTARNKCYPAMKGPRAKVLYGKKTSGPAMSDGRLRYWGEVNLGYRWQTYVDEADRLEMTISWNGRRGTREARTDVTLRRLQKFKVEKGAAYAWEYRALQGEKAVMQQGEVTVGDTGLITVPQIKVTVRGGRLIVKPKNQGSDNR